MIKRKNTETLGYRGLMEQSLKQQDFHHAFISVSYTHLRAHET